ncbi:MAG TPA: DUF3418 domain-containing protein, partial [Mycobacterium sp.]|nr:DUF3418 domain-containing protein [Mycobacterium sp.]
GKDLESLQHRLAGPARAAVADAVAGTLERTGLTGWPDDMDELPRSVESFSAGHTVRGFPAFTQAGAAVDLRVYPTPAEQLAAMTAGSRRLLRAAVPSPAKGIERQLDPRARLMLGNNPDGSLAALLEDCADAATDVLAPQPAWSRAEFEQQRARLATSLADTTLGIVGRCEAVLAALQQVQVALPDRPAPAQADAIADIRAQLAALFPTGFVTMTGAGRLADLTRYVTAIGRRLERLPRDVAGDRDRMDRVHAVEDAYDHLLAALSPARAAAPEVREIAWQIEELRVSLWAQQLGTPRPVSEQRIYRAIEKVVAG